LSEIAWKKIMDDHSGTCEKTSEVNSFYHNPYYRSLMRCLATFANIDGAITRKKIQLIEYFLFEVFGFDKDIIEVLFKFFDGAAISKQDFFNTIDKFGKCVDYNYNHIVDLINLLISLAHCDDQYLPEEETAIKIAIDILKLPPNTYEQILLDYNLKRLISQEEVMQCGSGFFLDKGFIITNYHVIEGCKKIKVRSFNQFADAEIIKNDIVNDLCLLLTDRKNGGFKISNDAIFSGQEILTYGYPQPDLQGFAPKVTQGIISSTAGYRDCPSHFQFDAAINQGNSGGPLVDKKTGILLGVICSTLDCIDAQNVNYAIKKDVLLSFLEFMPVLAKNLKHNFFDEEKNVKTVINELSQYTVQIFGCK
jgi:S1-C subfamily serine protease